MNMFTSLIMIVTVFVSYTAVSESLLKGKGDPVFLLKPDLHNYIDTLHWWILRKKRNTIKKEDQHAKIIKYNENATRAVVAL